MYIFYFFSLLILTQETIFSLVGMSGGVLFLARASVDFFSFLLLFFFAAKFTFESRPMPLSGIRYERAFLLFVFYSIMISIVSARSNFLTNMTEIFVLNRFALLAMAMPFIVNSDAKIKKILRFIWYLILLQAAFGVVQFVGGDPVMRFFQPTDFTNAFSGAERSFTSNRDINRQMLIGSVGDFISFGYMMLYGIILLFASNKKGVSVAVFLVLFLSLIFLSGSRTIFLVALAISSVFLFTRANLVWRVVLIGLIIVVLPIVFFSIGQQAANVEFEYTDFRSIFSSQFITVLMNQRLGHLVLYIPTLLTDPIVLMGFSPDRLLVERYVFENYSHVLPYIYLASFYHTLEDFYLAAMLSYYGLIGTAIFYFSQYRILTSALQNRNSRNPTLAQLALLVLLGLIAINLLSFGNQSFENRGLSFMFWVSVGLYASTINIQSRNKDL